MDDFWERLARYIFLACALLAVVIVSAAYGYFAFGRKWWPVPQLRTLYGEYKELTKPSDAILTIDAKTEVPIAEIIPGVVNPGLLLVAANHGGRDTSVRIIDRDGKIFHEWIVVWSEIWADDEGVFPPKRRPQTGMYVHGADIMADGDVVVNIEHLSTLRLDMCGGIDWKIDNLGHHSVHMGDDGTFWISGEKWEGDTPAEAPYHQPPFRNWTLDQMAPDGTVLRSIPVIDIFKKNDLYGMLMMGTLQNQSPFSVVRDTTHLNDVEPFPADMASEVFAPGDLLVSLRNVQTVMVVDPDTLEIKFRSTGEVTRQHDPDFMPGDRISVFDNQVNTGDPRFGPPSSRVVEFNAITGEKTVALEPTGDEAFYTEIMGEHQRLPNGNFLIIEAGEGRILEYTPDGKLAYRYENRIDHMINGRVYTAKVLPESMDAEFFTTRKESCAQ